MLALALSCVYGVPAYYIARSRGRSGLLYGALCFILALVAILATDSISALNPEFDFHTRPSAVGILAIPLLPIALLYLLPPGRSTPGKGYLTIVFTCPECSETISFPRHREGVADFCPECGELITVPTDEHTPAIERGVREKPDQTEGEVCLESFGMRTSADVLASVLETSGIAARVRSDDGGSTLPHVGMIQGHQVLIDIRDWDKAAEIADGLDEPSPL